MSDMEPTEGDLNTDAARTEWNAWRAARSTPEAASLLEEDGRLFLHQALSSPCLDVIERAEGSALITADGRRLIDFHGNGVHHVGYGHPRVVEAVRRQIGVLPFCVRRYTNRSIVALAERLVSLAPPGLTRVLFAPGGAEAVSMAIKLARVATGRAGVLGFEGAFHGATMEAISAGGEAIFREGLGGLFAGDRQVLPPAARAWGSCEAGDTARCLREIEGALAAGRFAALLAEPIRATSALTPSAGFWEGVRDLCTRYGTLLIFDEIYAGLGRTGRWWAGGHWNAAPDIMVCGKALGGGIVPMAAMVAREDLNVAGTGAIGHFTHEKSPVGAAAALAVLDVIEEEGLVARAATLGEQVVAFWRGRARTQPAIVDVRGRGLLMGVDLRAPGGDEGASRDLASRAMYEAMRLGVNLKVSGGTTLTLTPPLNISANDLQMGLDALARAVDLACAWAAAREGARRESGEER